MENTDVGKHLEELLDLDLEEATRLWWVVFVQFYTRLYFIKTNPMGFVSFWHLIKKNKVVFFVCIFGILVVLY